MFTTSVSIIAMSHLSDAKIEKNFNPTQADLRIEFAKYLILRFGENMNQEIVPDVVFIEFKEKMGIK